MLNIPLNNDILFNYENIIYNSDTIYHTSIKPLTFSSINNSFNTKNKFISVNKKGKYFLNISPIVGGMLSGDTKEFSYNSQLGIQIHSIISKKLALNTNISYNVNKYPKFYQNNINKVSLPHYGKYYEKNNTYYYTDFSGYLSYSPNHYFNFQFGKYKNFFGDGYRSILYSDNSNANWFLKGQLEIWKIKYTVIYNAFKDINSDYNNYNLYDKYSTVHSLSWNIGKRINFNLLETVLWRGQDSSGYRGFDVNYVNPIIFYRPVEFSIGSPDNVIMGGGFKIKIAKTNHFYGQVILDEFKLNEIKAQNGWWANKYGYQIGFKTYNLLNAKQLFWLIEYNRMRPFTFSHRNSLENWGNYYQPMSHPLGANFDEFVSIIKYPYNKWLFKIKAVYSRHGEDYGELHNTNYGGNIYRSYNDNTIIYGNTQNQGNLVSLKQIHIATSYLLQKEWNLRYEMGIIYHSSDNYNNLYIYGGIKTDIFNNNVDY